jgi:hypothetical protein
MQLFEVISKLNELPDETFICVRRPWARDAETLLVPYPTDLRIPAEILAQGYEYFLEVSIAREILEDFPQPLSERAVDFVLYYAEYDAFPDWAYST